MRNLLKRLGNMGKTIIVSSHILPELADICNKIGIIDRGVMKVNANVSDVMRQLRQNVVVLIKVASDIHDAKRDLESHATVQDVEIRGDSLYVTLHDSITEFSSLATDLVQAGHKLKMFREDELDLESAFMALTKGTRESEEER